MGTSTDLPTQPSQHDRVEEYLGRVAAHDVAAARSVVLAELAAQGGALSRVIDHLLVPAMTEVGDRWYDGRWNAAQEHVASGITERALSAASVRARTTRPAADAPTVVIACPRGEGHVLPSRLVAELLVEAGADVVVLGLPVPDRDLAAYLADTRPDALVLSCTEPLAVPGVRDAIAAAHQVGVPVLAGGRGLGPDPRRAMALGADGWAGRPDEAVRLLRTWHTEPPDLAPAPVEDREVGSLQRLRDSFVDDVLGVLVRRVYTVGQFGQREVDHARSDLMLMTSALACALMADDERLFTEYVAWGRGLLPTRGIPAAVLDQSLEVIADSLGPGFPGARRLLTAALAEA